MKNLKCSDVNKNIKKASLMFCLKNLVINHSKFDSPFVLICLALSRWRSLYAMYSCLPYLSIKIDEKSFIEEKFQMNISK